MRYLMSLLVLASLLVAQKPTKAQYETINEAELRRHLTFIASDELKGRDTGSPELQIAAKYLAAHLESFGYKGLGENGSYFQPMTMYQTEFSNEGTYIEINGKRLPYEIGKDLSIYSFGNEAITIEADLVAVGTGLQTEEHKHYEQKDVEGRAALRFDLSGDLAEVAKTKGAYTHQQIRNKLFDNKAKAVINVLDENRAGALVPLYMRYASQNRLSMEKDDNSRVYVLISPEFYAKLLKQLKRKSIANNKVVNLNAKIKIHVPADAEEIVTNNVVGYLEGSDPTLKSEYVGYGSHYDHTGVNPDGSINNGADDDGSGTVAVLKMAEAISMNPPKRSTFIIFHTGEEKGLLGSRYYSDNPLIPLKNMVAMINMDMVGSYYKPERVHVVGADRISQELHDINEAANKELGNLILDYTYNAKDHPERIYYRSDHYNYARYGVPVIFYTNDNPDHYHKPSDTVDTINFEKMKRITRLALTTGMAVQNRAKRLKINEGFVPDASR